MRSILMFLILGVITTTGCKTKEAAAVQAKPGVETSGVAVMKPLVCDNATTHVQQKIAGNPGARKAAQ